MQAATLPVNHHIVCTYKCITFIDINCSSIVSDPMRWGGRSPIPHHSFLHKYFPETGSSAQAFPRNSCVTCKMTFTVHFNGILLSADYVCAFCHCLEMVAFIELTKFVRGGISFTQSFSIHDRPGHHGLIRRHTTHCTEMLHMKTLNCLSNAMHGQNINLPLFVCLCVRHTFCQLA